MTQAAQNLVKTNVNKKTANVDKRIQEAQNRRAERRGQPIGSARPSQPPPAGEQESKRKRLSPEERQARDEQREKDRAERRQAREAIREQKRLEREANRQTPHMKKVEKAAANLPQMSAGAKALYEQITGQGNLQEAFALSQNLLHFVRMQRTMQALESRLIEGQPVKIIGGTDARLHGKVGVVSKVQRIHCYVEIPDMERPVYLFTSDVKALTEKQAQKVHLGQATA